VVWDIAGDGSIQMNIQEMATAVAYRIPMKIAVLNNGYLGMVRQWQTLFWHNRLSYTDIADVSPDFVKLAEAYGAVGIRVATPAEIGPALARAREVTDRPVFLDFMIQREANVWPMVPAGAGNDEMMNA
jgi:acetolactate synthase-1/2/3 large subunit